MQIFDKDELERRMADPSLSFDERADAAEQFLAGVWASVEFSDDDEEAA